MNSTESPQQTKTVLFCPNCEYRSDADSGWMQYTVRGHTQRHCPACYEVVDTRPVHGARNAWELYTESVQSGLVAWRVGLRRIRESVKQLASL